MYENTFSQCIITILYIFNKTYSKNGASWSFKQKKRHIYEYLKNL